MLCMLWVYYHTAKNFGNKTLAALGLEASNRYVGSVPVPFSAQYPSAVADAVVIPAVTDTIAATTVTAVLVAAPNINTAAVVAAAVIAFVAIISTATVATTAAAIAAATAAVTALEYAGTAVFLKLIVAHGG